MFFDLCSKFLSFAVSAAAILAGMSVLLLVALALPKTFLRESAQTARALSGLCRRQPVALGVFVLFAVVLSLHVGGKGERSPLAMFPGGFLSSPSFCGVPPTVSGLPVNAPHGAVPYEAFSNLHVSAFSATTTNVCLSASWYPLTNGVAVLDVYSSTNLLDGVWLPQAAVEVDAADTNAVFTLPLDWFGTPSALFLRLGSRFDFDGDGLPDAFEKWTCETDATARDSDSDGLSDGEELRLGTDPLLADTDGDGLGDGAEVLLGTSPVAPDTDGDSLHDGWEHQNGLDPLSGDSPGQSALETDADDDGLSLWEECQYGTSPDNGSTFGIPDGDFVDNGMRPRPPDDYVEVPVSIGDPSGSESERWAISVVEQGNSYRQYKVVSDSYGTVKTRNLRLARGGRYAITVSHIASNQSDGPDYDWKAQIGNLPDNRVLPRGVTHSDSSRWFSVPEIGAVADNRDGLLGTCDQSFGDENNTTGKKAYLYIPKADLVGYAALRGSEDREVPEEERFDPGYLVMGTGTADTDAMPAKVKFAKLESGFALSRYMRFSEAGRIKARGSYGWAVAGTTDEIAIPGNVDVDAYRKLAINSIADWPDGTTHVDVEYIVRDRDGELLTASTNRLLRPYLIACGNSLTWGLRRYNHALETPQWNAPWTTYPGEAEWQAEGLPPANRFLRAYQGYRGYLAEKLPGVTWLGNDTNGHGPPHLGFPGATAAQIRDKIGAHASLFTKDNCYQVIIYCSGMNDCTKTNDVVDEVSYRWRTGVSANDVLRTNRGRTLFVALKIPEVSEAYSSSTYTAINRNISGVNANMNFESENPFFKFVLGDTAQINHANDDGLHFSDVGYGIMADRIYSAITEGLHDD